MGLLSLAISGLLASIITAGISAGVQQKAVESSNQANKELAAEANASQIQQVQMTNEFNAAEAQKARDWNEYMSNTAVQRQMADMQAAGINPLMAASTGGASYSSPASASGNVAQIQRAQVSPEYLNLTGISSALQSFSNAMLINKFINDRQTNYLTDLNNWSRGQYYSNKAAYFGQLANKISKKY